MRTCQVSKPFYFLPVAVETLRAARLFPTAHTCNVRLNIQVRITYIDITYVCLKKLGQYVVRPFFIFLDKLDGRFFDDANV